MNSFFSDAAKRQISLTAHLVHSLPTVLDGSASQAERAKTEI